MRWVKSNERVANHCNENAMSLHPMTVCWLFCNILYWLTVKTTKVVLSVFSCDVTAINSLGQTARDIAEFWLHEDIANELSQLPLTTSGSALTVPQIANYFCESPLNRMSQRRNDSAWINDLALADTTVYILFVELDLLAQSNSRSSDGSGSCYRPVRFTYQQLKTYLEADHKPTVVFLGVDEAAANDGVQCGWFAVDVSLLSGDVVNQLCPQAERVSIHPRMLQMPRTEAAIVGQARSMLAWHDRYRFCPSCGSATETKDAGYKRVCTKKECRSNSGFY
jgi:NAD+ diphosphatase